MTVPSDYLYLGYLGTYGVPRGVGVSYERGAPVCTRSVAWRVFLRSAWCAGYEPWLNAMAPIAQMELLTWGGATQGFGTIIPAWSCLTFDMTLLAIVNTGTA